MVVAEASASSPASRIRARDVRGLPRAVGASRTVSAVRTRLDGIAKGARTARYLTRQHGMALPLVAGAHLLFKTLEPSRRLPDAAALSVIYDHFRDLLGRDLANVEQGYYPDDLLFQLPLRRYLSSAPDGLREVLAMAWRRRRNAWSDVPPQAATDEYPPYYRRTFHWQTDGWFSRASARRYDAGVEFLFTATADVMRRMCIPPIVAAFGREGSPRVLDVACGTGRFLQQLHRAMPGAKLYGLDLSPYYLQEARSLLRDVADLSLLRENAEHIPMADGVFDAVTSVFLFHELPKPARRAVLAEMARVAKPGAPVVVCDSAQADDGGGSLQPFQEDFHDLFHEPYYRGYVRDPLEPALAAAGLEVVETFPAFWSKVVVARKPG